MVLYALYHLVFRYKGYQLKDSEKKEIFEIGTNAAKEALKGASFPLLLMDEFGFNESSNIQAMGWNSICVGEENKKLWEKEHKRTEYCRKYFEDGCLCIINKKIDLKGNDVSNLDATIYYENNCRCSRNYK